jgi:hypothetical protein
VAQLAFEPDLAGEFVGGADRSEVAVVDAAETDIAPGFRAEIKKILDEINGG